MSTHTNLRATPETRDIAREAARRASDREGIDIPMTQWIARAIREQTQRENDRYDAAAALTTAPGDD